MRTCRANSKSAIAAAPPRASGRLASAPPPPHSPHSSYWSYSSHSQAAFTMIEIAIALGIIGFALVAIIGVLPAGMNVQRETHQDTAIGQDGDFFLQAICNGGPSLGPGTSTSLDFLTNYVEAIAVGPNIYNNNRLTNGQVILGLLTTPTALGNVTARIRALTGAATEQNGSNAATAFRYYMNVEVEPFITPSPSAIDFNYNNDESNYLASYLYEVRLKFSWPVLNAVTGKVGPGRQTCRSLVSGYLLPYTNSAPALWFFQPNTYTNL